MSTLLDLIARLEKLDRPSRRIDAEIVVAFDLRPDWLRKSNGHLWVDMSLAEPVIRFNGLSKRNSAGNPPIGDYPKLTASLDAAVALAERVLPGCELELTNLYGVARVSVGLNFEDGPSYGEHKGGSLPISLLIAILRAKAAS